jgi:UDP-N-acetylmuramoyl-tripeptide--D-alanyl-D-alanine ligase
MRYTLQNILAGFCSPAGKIQIASGIRYALRDTSGLLRTPVGRSQFIGGLRRRTWPVLGRMAALYRRHWVKDTRIVAVVGSCGKTTTMRAVSHSLGIPHHPMGHRNAWDWLARSIFRIRPGDRHAVVEVGIDKVGQMLVYANVVRPDVTVVTAIGSEHNRSLGTPEVTRAEKSLMVRALPVSGVAILNGDDPNVLWMKGLTRARVVTFGMDKANDVRASHIVPDWPKGTRFKVHLDGRVRDFHIRLTGRHMVYAALAGIAVAFVEGVDLDQVAERLGRLTPTPRRLEPVQLANGAFMLLDCEKAPLETIEAAFDTLSEIPARRRIVVLGEVSEPPGSQGPVYRHLGERISQVASKAILVCRKKSFRSYAGGARRGGFPPHALVDAGDNVLKAAEALRGDLGPGDVVLVKGRDTQRLDRVWLSLAGRTVRCDIDDCDVRAVVCESCPMLERGWKRLRVVI